MHPHNSVEPLKDYLQQQPFEEDPSLQLHFTRLIISPGQGLSLSLLVIIHRSIRENNRYLLFTSSTPAVYTDNTRYLHDRHQLFTRSTPAVWTLNYCYLHRLTKRKYGVAFHINIFCMIYALNIIDVTPKFLVAPYRTMDSKNAKKIDWEYPWKFRWP